MIAPESRLGKARALNAGLERASEDIVIFTDANNPLEPGALAALARWFSDPSVGAVAGEKRVEGSEGEGLYWRFESWLKRRESRTGTTIGLVGELGAIRRSLYRDLPGDVVIDDLWIALDVIEGGHRVVYEPAALTRERAAASSGQEWERRSRIIAGVVDLLIRRRHLLGPGRSPATFQLWGHRLVRSSLGPLAHVALLGLTLSHVRSSRLSRLFIGGHVLGAALVAWSMAWRDGCPGRSARVAQVLFLQAVAIGGVVPLHPRRSARAMAQGRPPEVGPADVRDTTESVRMRLSSRSDRGSVSSRPRVEYGGAEAYLDPARRRPVPVTSPSRRCYPPAADAADGEGA